MVRSQQLVPVQEVESRIAVLFLLDSLLEFWPIPSHEKGGLVNDVPDLWGRVNDPNSILVLGGNPAGVMGYGFNRLGRHPVC